MGPAGGQCFYFFFFQGVGKEGNEIVGPKFAAGPLEGQKIFFSSSVTEKRSTPTTRNIPLKGTERISRRITPQVDFICISSFFIC
jgi:hypothetical protein